MFSGIQPTGTLHLGNYFGAVQQWVDLQKTDKQLIFCIVDLHALTTPQVPYPALLTHALRTVFSFFAVLIFAKVWVSLCAKGRCTSRISGFGQVKGGAEVHRGPVI